MGYSDEGHARIAPNNHTAGSGTYGVPGSHTPGVRIGKFVEVHLLGAQGLNLTNVPGEHTRIIHQILGDANGSLA